MPIALPPLAVTALKCAALAGVAYAAGRRQARPQPTEQAAALDALEDGVTVGYGREGTGVRVDVAAAKRQFLRLAPRARFALDACLIARIRLRPTP